MEDQIIKFSLEKLKFFLKKYKFLILANIILALLASVYFIRNLTPSWKASAVIKIGQVGAINSAQPFIPESAEDLIKRLYQTTLIDEVISTMKISSADAEQIKDSLRIEKILNQNSIQVVLKSPSADLAKAFINELTNSIKSTHDVLLAPKKESLIKRIEVLKQSEALSELLKNEISSKNSNETVRLIDRQNILITALINQNLLELKEISDSSVSYTTGIVNDIYIDPAPLKPNIKLIVLLFIFLGAMNGIILSYSHKIFNQKI